jgi:CubicO group peptidase (beta-lactamase class C family)
MALQKLRPTLATLLMVIPIAAASSEIATVDAFAQSLRAQTGAPGAGVGWMVNGRIEIAVAGVRARGTDAQVTSQDLWHIGSNAKAMTATLAARLVEAGVLDWSDTIGARLGDLKMHPDYGPVTLEMLLSHRGGLPANLGFFAARRLAGPREDRNLPSDRRAYVEGVLSGAPETAPGTAFGYSNAGYVVAGAMIEAATGQSWEELIEAWVFEPLDMESAGFGAPGNANTLSQPRGHGGMFPWSRAAVTPGPKADNIPALGPAGTVHLSLRDHLKFLRAHLSRPAGFLSAESWDKLQGDVSGQGYAMGWALRSDGAMVHAGSNTFWFNIAFADAGRGVVIALAVNDGALARVRPATEDLLAQILAELDRDQ